MIILDNELSVVVNKSFQTMYFYLFYYFCSWAIRFVSVFLCSSDFGFHLKVVTEATPHPQQK